MNAINYSDSKSQICIRSYKDDDQTIAIEVENLGWGSPKRTSNLSNSHSIKRIQKEVNWAESDWAYRLLLNTSCTDNPFPYTVNSDRALQR